GDAQSRARAKVVQHLEQQRQLLAEQLEGMAFEATRPVYRINERGERVRVMQPMHVRRGWFEDANGTVFFQIRYGAKPLPLDKAANSAVEVGRLDVSVRRRPPTAVEIVNGGRISGQRGGARAGHCEQMVWRRAPPGGQPAAG
ncbi:MAG: hypothetical protein K0R41_3081, partial [Geminicoccaceae bacterium]|nr:hypothetical protein [Geminicoccaceae bacterium]